MAEFLQKQIKTYDEFNEAITLYNLSIGKGGRTYVGSNQVYNSHLTPFRWEFLEVIGSNLVAKTLTGGSTIAGDEYKITLTKAASQKCAIESIRASREDYYILVGFNLQSISSNGTCNILTIDNVAGVKIQLSSRQVSGSVNYFWLTYTLNGTTYYHNTFGIPSAWQTTPTSMYNHDFRKQYYFRLEKKNGFYNMSLYNDSFLQLFDILSIDASGWTTVGDEVDTIIVGDKTTAASSYALDITDLIGFGNEDGGASSAAQYIFDLGAVPIIPGRYLPTIKNYDDFDAIIDDWDNLTSATMLSLKLKSATNNQKLSQGFQPGATAPIEKVVAWIKKTGTIGANAYVWAEVWTDDGADNPLAILPGMKSNMILSSSFNTTTFKKTDFFFNSRIQLDAGIKYHIVFATDAGVSASNYLSLGYRSAAAAMPPRDYNGTGWANATITSSERIMTAVLNANNRKFKSYISVCNKPAYKTLSSKADWEGYNQVASQITTADIPGSVRLDKTGGSYYSSGYNQNDIDLGFTPTEFVRFTKRDRVPAGCRIDYDVAYSSDNITWSAFFTLTFVDGYDTGLLGWGYYRYWRIKVSLFNPSAPTKSPILDSWTLDCFGAMTEIDSRTQLPEGRYAKLKIEHLRNAGTAGQVSGFLVEELSIKWRTAYELYIKSVKYKISPDEGIMADMDLGSVI